MLAIAFDDALPIRKKGDILQIQVMKKALKCAFPYTIPIFAGFWFLGLTYGIYMNVNGFSFIYPMLMSLTIFAGSIEFIAVNMLMGAFDLLQALAMTLMINARHLFYGIAMLDKFRGLGWKKIYLIFGMCDESFSINYTADIPEDVDRGWFMFFVTLLNHFYWFSGATLGGIRFLPAVQHGGAGLRHDGDVRRHLPGAVAQGERSRQLALRPCRIFALSDPVWGGSVHGSGDAGHSRCADAAEKTVGEGRG